MEFVLAQVNIGRMRAPVDSPQLAGFMAALDPVNALADAAPGFVWRLQTEDGDATAIRGFGPDAVGAPGGVIINMSVWESVEALAAYAYGAGHIAVLRRRREWGGAPQSIAATGGREQSRVPGLLCLVKLNGRRVGCIGR